VSGSSYETTSYAGYILSGASGGYISAQANIILPTTATLYGNPSDTVLFWIGLGGFPNPFPFWQAGVEIRSLGGTWTPYIFYEAFQSSTVWEAIQIVPSADIGILLGQNVEIALSFYDGWGYACFYSSSQSYCTYDKTIQGVSELSSVEWITEPLTYEVGPGGPCNGNYCYPMPDFGSRTSPVPFFNMWANAANGGSPSGVIDTTTLNIGGCIQGICGAGQISQKLAPNPFLTGDMTSGFTVYYNGPS
jgi:hypothetical protein